MDTDPNIVERVGTLNTPTVNVDVVVSETSVAVTLRSAEFLDVLSGSGIDTVPITRLLDLVAQGAEGFRSDRIAEHCIVVPQQYRDSTIIDLLLTASKLSRRTKSGTINALHVAALGIFDDPLAWRRPRVCRFRITCSGNSARRRLPA
ncbi:citrate lyase subunit alpha [Burkholderia cepacia]|uniref:citrate lyase subunit alpha n=1 Tax=Burkholderia cepacia TaxID=292 RepID=UPI0018C66A20